MMVLPWGKEKPSVVPLRNKLSLALAAAEHTAAHGLGYGPPPEDRSLPEGYMDDPKPSLTTRIRDYQTMIANADALDASIHRQTEQLAGERKAIAALKMEIAGELDIRAEDFSQ